ncbi:MAG: hypothetical protein F6K40_02855 [Okeania sp. SIO3I5]|uniref:hypothetical protein n=1 Tax=Okeania sp. SIO3I5 TaxID=2607805 RepID=UPI0013BDE8C2|nr:hypothetical protein [Okeania sp. SIO3I5]NEQ35301.1 hypothetical protein [Okeania sp. SIO3I5]
MSIDIINIWFSNPHWAFPSSEWDFWRSLLDRLPVMFKQRLVQKIQMCDSLTYKCVKRTTVLYRLQVTQQLNSREGQKLAEAISTIQLNRMRRLCCIVSPG